MKLKTTIIALLIFGSSFAQGFNKDHETFVYGLIDPTFTDRGFQFGAGIKKEMNWFFASVEITTYPELKDGYTDLVGTAGIVLQFNKLTLSSGLRMGAVYRGGNGHGLIGLLGQVEFEVAKKIRLGLRYTPDQRQGQKFYGDSQTRDGSIIFTNPIVVESVAGLLIFELN